MGTSSGTVRYWPYAGVLVFLVALVPIGKVVVSGKSKIPRVSVVEARSGGTEAQVMAEGAIVPGDVSNVSVLPQVDARVVRVFVRPGARVKKGDLLAELDPLNQAAQLREAEFGVQSAEAQMGLTRSPHREEEIQQAREAVRSAQAKLDLVKTPYRPEKLKQMELQVQADRQAVAEAEARLDLLRRGSRPQEIQRAQEAVASARAKLIPLQNEHQRSVSLHAKDLLSDADLEKSAGEVAVAKSALTQAEEALSLVKEGASPEEIRIATAALERAKLTWQAHIQEVNEVKLGPRDEAVVQATADLNRAQLALQAMLRGARPEELRQAQAKVGQSRSQANRQREMLEQRFVRAPIAGVVIARNINPGEIASRGEPRADGVAPLINNTRSMFIIADDTTVEFQANVDQRFYHSVKVGNAASVTIEALPGRSFQGHVTRMNPLINNEVAGAKKGDPSAPLTFSVWVRVANPDKRLVSGQVGLMRLTRRQQGLLIPQAALANFTLGEGLVYVEKDGIITARPVKYDDNTDGRVRVLSGLEEGERVVVSKVLDLKSGMAVEAEVSPGSDQP